MTQLADLQPDKQTVWLAGIVASRLDRWDRPVLLVDIGTNGEIVLAHDGRVTGMRFAVTALHDGRLPPVRPGHEQQAA